MEELKTTYKPGYQIWRAVETVTSRQSPTNPEQHTKIRIVMHHPTYRRSGVEMKGTELSPGPSLLGGFPKQGLAKEEDGQEETPSPSKKKKEKNQE